MSFKILRTDIPVQCTHAPHLRGRLAQIPTDSCIVSDTQSAINMCPCQIWKPRFPNVKIREKSIELPEGTKVTNLLHKIANLSPSFWAEMKKRHYKKFQTEFR